MNIEFSHKKFFGLFILAVSLLLCLGAFYNRQVAHATTSQSDTADQLDSADQKISSFTFHKKMSFRVLRAATTNGEIDKEKQVPVTAYIGPAKKDSPANMSVGVINENTVPKITGARFVGAYVEFPDTGKETQIYYTGRYSENAGDTADQNKRNYYTYYAYSPTPETGVLLEENEENPEKNPYIKLLYEATYDLSYRVEDEQGKKLSDGLQEGDIGGYFVTPTKQLTAGNKLAIHFIPAQAKGYQIKEMYKATYNDKDKLKTKTSITYDNDISASVDITENSTIVAVVKTASMYRMHVVNPFEDHHGYICYKGYGGFYDPEKDKIYGTGIEKNDDLSLLHTHAKGELCDVNDSRSVETVTSAKGVKHGVRYIDVNESSDVDAPKISYYNEQDRDKYMYGVGDNSIPQSDFCSYTKNELDDENGNVVKKDGKVATTTASPGGTFYFVMYSQTGTKWQFGRLTINGTPIEANYDGNVHDTPLKNGMVAHFKFDRFDKDLDIVSRETNFDPHLEKDYVNMQHDIKINRKNARLKFECWVTNASNDINVDFDCNGNKSESLTLTKAQGVKRIVASSYDEDHTGELWWDSLYNGQPYYRMVGNNPKEYNNGNRKPSPDNEYNEKSGSGQLPKELFYEEDGTTNFTKAVDGTSHTRMEIQDSNVPSGMTRGNYSLRYRYLYYDALPGYDAKNAKIDITGADTVSTVKHGLIANGVAQGYYKGKDNDPANKALNEAIADQYTSYIKYNSARIRHRNISITIPPYKYTAFFYLGDDGGTINGKSTYTDSQEYTIEDGSNHILMPTATPVKKDSVFAGWQYTPLNVKYEKDKEKLKKVLMPNEKFEINDKSYDWGLNTKLVDTSNMKNIKFFSYVKHVSDKGIVTYSLEQTHPKFYSEDEGKENKFEFDALWIKKGDPLPQGKAIYTIKIYKQVSQSEYSSLNVDEKVEKDGKKYKIVSSNNYLGTDGQTIIGIPPEAGVGDYAGYKFNKTLSNVKLKHFMNTGVDKDKEPDTLTYYYDFDNTQNLSIWNKVAGNMGDQNQSFDVSITLRDENEQPVTDKKDVIGTNATIWDGDESNGAKATGTLNFKNGKAIIHLKGNQYVTIKDIDIGSCDVSVVKQTSVQKLYTTQYELVDGKKSKSDNSNQLSDLKIEKNENPKITFINVRDVPNTRLNIPNDHPGQMLMLLIVSCGAFYLVYKKNERRIRRMILAAAQMIENVTRIHY